MTEASPPEPVWSLLAQFAHSMDRLDAELLLADQLGCTRLQMLAEPQRLVSGISVMPFARRMRGEPVAYILGRKEFWSLDLTVTRDVLIPRPDSETLIEAALAHFGNRTPRAVVDLGTGSGALLLAALTEWPEAVGIGYDISGPALKVARANAERLGINRAAFFPGDWSGLDAPVPLVLCNPPYIAEGAPLPRDVRDWEPHEALFAGPDGLDCYRAIAPLIGRQIEPGGVACIEIGHDQGDTAAALFRAQGLTVAVRTDLAGLPRCLAVTK